MRSLQETRVREIFSRDYYPLLEKLCVAKPKVRIEETKVGRTVYKLDGGGYDFYWTQDGFAHQWVGMVEIGKMWIGKKEGVYLWVWGDKPILFVSGNGWDDKVERKVRSYLNYTISQVIAQIVAIRCNRRCAHDTVVLDCNWSVKVAFKPEMVTLTLKPQKKKVTLRFSDISEVTDNICRLVATCLI